MAFNNSPLKNSALQLNNNHGNSSRQVNRQVFSNLFFQLGPSYDRINQVQRANDLYHKIRFKQSFIENPRKYNPEREKIVYQMNEIYQKIIESSPKINRSHGSIDDLESQYDDFLIQMQSPQPNFFSTAIKKPKEIRHSSELSKHYNEYSPLIKSNNEEKQLRVRNKNKVTILLKGRNHNTDRSKQDQSTKGTGTHTQHITIKDIGYSIPNCEDKNSSSNMKVYEMQDMILGWKKPHFKH